MLYREVIIPTLCYKNDTTKHTLCGKNVRIFNVEPKLNYTKLNSVALVRERTIPTERPPPVDEVCANFLMLNLMVHK
jgi:hypothetical protein